ncbi:hypothetical protein B0813_002899 [Candidatus Fervidibacteria bacterium JGI MDM2 SSWTFF-3-K9]
MALQLVLVDCVFGFAFEGARVEGSDNISAAEIHFRLGSKCSRS